jgi:hypothetical protein
MYQIIGKYQGKSEVIDLADDKKDAEYMAREYAMAFGSEWDISICRFDDEPI